MLVLGVTPVGGTQADWQFSVPVTVSGVATALVVNSQVPSATTQQATDTIRGTYASMGHGIPWTLNSAETHITPQPAFPQNGLTL